jgi:hypothetical protein
MKKVKEMEKPKQINCKTWDMYEIIDAINYLLRVSPITKK